MVFCQALSECSAVSDLENRDSLPWLLALRDFEALVVPGHTFRKGELQNCTHRSEKDTKSKNLSE